MENSASELCNDVRASFANAPCYFALLPDVIPHVEITFFFSGFITFITFSDFSVRFQSIDTTLPKENKPFLRMLFITTSCSSVPA